MKARIQSVEQLKQVASAKLQEEFSQRYQEATLEGAIQGMAFVMYSLEMSRVGRRADSRSCSKV